MERMASGVCRARPVMRMFQIHGIHPQLNRFSVPTVWCYRVTCMVIRPNWAIEQERFMLTTFYREIRETFYLSWMIVAFSPGSCLLSRPAMFIFVRMRLIGPYL